MAILPAQIEMAQRDMVAVFTAIMTVLSRNIFHLKWTLRNKWKRRFRSLETGTELKNISPIFKPIAIPTVN